MTEAYTTLPNTLRFYGKVENGEITEYGSQIPFNFELISKTGKASTSQEYLKHINDWINAMPKGNGIQANWVVSEIFLRQKSQKWENKILISFLLIFLVSS